MLGDISLLLLFSYSYFTVIFSLFVLRYFYNTVIFLEFKNGIQFSKLNHMIFL